MSLMQTCRLVTVAMLLAACAGSVRADELSIQSIDKNHERIVFDAVTAAANYQVQTASTPTGAWDVAVATIGPTEANAVTATVSMAAVAAFYRVVAWTNVAAPALPYLIVDLSGGPSTTSYPVAYLSDVPEGGWTDEHKTTKLVLRHVPAPTPHFTMGSPTDEVGRDGVSDETLHQVTLTQGFYIGVFEVTQRQWELVMGNWPSQFTNETYRQTRPVETVSYYDIRENPDNSDDPAVTWPANGAVNADSFMGRLRARTGLWTFDLPTESQWEYACRAATTTALNSGQNLTEPIGVDEQMSLVGRYYYNGGEAGFEDLGCEPDEATATAGSYQPSGWGLYDLHGNVWEWCLDWRGDYPETGTDPAGATSGDYRVARGGSWTDDPRECRSARRGYGEPNGRNGNVGLRACCTTTSGAAFAKPAPGR